MAKLFNIELKETISGVFEIEAETREEAIQKAYEGYYKGENILDGIGEQNRDLVAEDIDSNTYITDIRKQEILENLITYVFDHNEEKEDCYKAFKDIIGLTDEEMEGLGISQDLEGLEKTNEDEYEEE